MKNNLEICLSGNQWRIVAESHSKEKTDIHQLQFLQSEFETKQLPLMASQLLGWDTTEHWGKISRKSLNFPGLCQVELEVPEHRKRSSTPHHINVMRTTETTVESYVTDPF